MELHTLLQNLESEELTQALRSAFAPYSELLDITGSEHKVLMVLLNLTYKRKDVKDLTCVGSAKAALNDKKHFQTCIAEVKWYHTHNLKYPDIRVSHQRLLAQVVDGGLGVVSSASYPTQFGWSHNSSTINHAKLFLTTFIWRGACTCLAEQLAKQDNFWVEEFRSMGLLKQEVITVCEQIAEQFPPVDLPEQLSQYTPQLLIPYENSYLSVSPVVSHSVFAEIQRACRNKYFKYGTVEHDRPTNVGDLPSSVGGSLNVLKYFVETRPLSSLSKHYLSNENSLFDMASLKESSFIKALAVLAFETKFNTLRQRRVARVLAVKTVRVAILEWLDRVIRLSKAHDSEAELPNLVSLLVNQEIDTVVVMLSSELNQQLSQWGRTKRYAFHPELMVTLKQQIQRVLTHQVSLEDEFANESVKYIYCKSLRVYDAEGMPNPYLMGVPSITALDGLGHQFQRRLQKLIGGGINVIGVATYIRSYLLHDQKQLPEADRLKKEATKTAPQRAAIRHVPKCDITFDLVFRVQADNEKSISMLSDDVIKAAFPSRYAGGTLHPPSLYDFVDWCQVFANPTTLFELVRALPKGGSWLYPTAISANSLTELSNVLLEHPTFRPAAIGYVALEESKLRVGALTDKHCYVEPVLGLLECKDVVSVRLLGARHFFNHAFWAMHCQKTSMLMKKAKFEYD